MLRMLLGIAGGLLLAFLIGICGLLLGIYLGGNYAVSFEFLCVRGYEAMGSLGLIVGLVLGAGIGVFLFLKITKQKTKS